MYAILDIESSGGQYNEEGITEIAIYRHDGHEVVDYFSSLVNPERPIDPYVTKLTGINNKMLSKAPKFYEVAKRILEITTNAVLVAHNAQFDYRILKLEFERLGYDFEIQTLCTVELSQKLIPEAESHSLGKLVRSLGIPITDRHRATGDALATVKLFELLLEKDKDKEILESSLKYIKIKKVDSDLKDILDTLPTSTGIFYLYDDSDSCILIGRARNIRKQVNKLFLSSSRRAKSITKETVRATFEKTGSELIAGIKEGIEISKKKPKYNKRQRFNKRLFYIEMTGDNLRISNRKNGHPILTSFSNWQAAERFLEAHDIDPSGIDETYIEDLFGKYSIHNRTCLVRLKGRKNSERALVLIDEGKIEGYAYTELQIQGTDRKILNNLLNKINSTDQVEHQVRSFIRTSKDRKIIDLK